MSDSGINVPTTLQSVFLGACRTVAVHTITYPLEVVKIRQQCSSVPQHSLFIAKDLLRQHGIAAFYRGLTPQLLKTTCRQIWWWPMITQLPPHLKARGFQNLEQQIITGISIATIDALLTAPLERAQVLAALTAKSHFSVKKINKGCWHSVMAYWGKRSVSMTSFLTTQQWLRERYRLSKSKLTVMELTQIGVLTALIVSIVTAPLDLISTVQQMRNSSNAILHIKKRWIVYRGWPLYALSLVVQSVASVFLIEQLHFSD